MQRETNRRNVAFLQSHVNFTHGKQYHVYDIKNQKQYSGPNIEVARYKFLEGTETYIEGTYIKENL